MAQKIKIDNNAEVKWTSEEYGVRANESLTPHKQLGLLETVKNISLTVLREVAYMTTTPLKNKIQKAFKFYEKYTDLNTGPSEKKALAVCLHGLNCTTENWDDHINQLEQLSEDFPEFSADIFAPNIPEKGHCTFEDEGLKKIYQKILTWAENNEGKPIVIYGHSNGSRIGLKLETLLRATAPTSPVHLSIVAGVVYGTSAIDKAELVLSQNNIKRMTRGKITPVACENLKRESEPSKAILTEALKPLESDVAKRYFRKYAAAYDTYVHETGSSLPMLNPHGDNRIKEKDFIITDEGHNSIVSGARRDQVARSFHWINKCNGIKDTKKQFQINGDVNLRLNAAEGKFDILDHRPLYIRIYDIAIAIFKTFIFMIDIKMIRIILRSIKQDNQLSPTPELENPVNVEGVKKTFAYKQETYPWAEAENSDGLYLHIHGLNGHSTNWNPYVEELTKDYPNAHILTPEVAMVGNCDLETAADPILKIVEDYLTKFPGKSINLIGTSNGGRIAAYIESKLDPELLGDSSLSMVSIAGVHDGTELFDVITPIMDYTNLSKEIKEDYKPGSENAQKYLNKWKEKQATWKRLNKKVRHLFITSTEDECVFGLNRALPYHADGKSKYKVLSGESHISVVEASRSKVMKWLRKPN